MPHAKLMAVRHAYAAAYDTDVRDDVKRHKLSSGKYGKLLRHFTLSRAEWAFKTFREAQAAERKSPSSAATAAAVHDAIEALCMLERGPMRALEARFKAEKGTRTLLEEVGGRSPHR